MTGVATHQGRRTWMALIVGAALAIALALVSWNAGDPVATARAALAGASAGEVMDGAVVGDAVRASMRAARSGTYTVTLDSITNRGSFVANDAGGFDQELRMGDDAGVTMRIRDTVYIRGMGGDKERWAKAGPGSGAAGSFYRSLMAKALGPELMFSVLERSPATVESLSSAGTTLRSRLDYADILNDTLAPNQAASTGVVAPQPTDVTLVLDARGRPMTFTMVNATGTTVTTYAGWGSEVRIEAPPAHLVDPMK